MGRIGRPRIKEDIVQTTIRIPKKILAEIKILSFKEGKPASTVWTEMAKEYLKKKKGGE